MARTIIRAMYTPIGDEAAEILAELKQRKLGAKPGAERNTDAIDAVTKALGLQPGASDEQVRSAFAALFGDGRNAPGGEALSAAQLKICRENGVTPAAFLAAKKGLVR